MAEVSKVRRLVNPGRRKAKRKLSPLQKLFFGSKRQRAAVKRKRNAGPRSIRKSKKAFKRRTKEFYGIRLKKSSFARQVKAQAKARRKRNVSSIITIWPKGNPGRKRSYKRRKRNSSKRVVVINKGVKMARRRTRKVARRGYRRRRVGNPARRRRNYAVRRRRWHVSNPGRVRRHRRVNRGRRRNPGGIFSGTAGRIAGVIGGIAVTKMLNTFIPSSFSTGIVGNIATAVIAVAQGKLIGKVSKNTSLGDDFMVGGLAYAVASFLNQMFPSIGSYTGISGMGLIGGSQFYVPQVNLPGNMGAFVPVGAAMAPAPVMTGQQGGWTGGQQGVGAMRRRRVGRLM